MTENRYHEVRRLLREKKIEEAEKIHTELVVLTEGFSNEEKYWFDLLSSEIKRYKNDFQSAKNDLEEAFRLSKEIKLTKTQMSSLYGKIATIQYRMNNYSVVIPSLNRALSFLSNDIVRQNYYRRMLLNCFFQLKDEKNFLKTLKEGLNDILRGQIQTNWNSNLDFVWEFTWLARQNPWYKLVNEALDTSEVQPSDKIAQGLLEYARARLARQQLDRTKCLKHIQKSLNYCVTSSPDNFVLLSLNFVWMLQLFGEYQRAKNILLKCLQLVPNAYQKVFVLNNLGSNSRFTGEYKIAIQYLTESLKINHETVHNLWQAAYAHNTLGMVYTLVGNNKKAIEHYNSSMALNKKNNDFYGLGFTYGALGWLESNQGNLMQAEKWYKASVSTFKEKSKKVPAIILLAYAELLSRMGNNYLEKIEALLTEARNQIWTHQKRLDIGRYYSTQGNIALNQKQFEQALKEFSLALEYCESFEVEAQTLLGITKTNLELFMISTDNFEYLEKARLFLTDLKLAAESSALISGEVDLILGIIEMHTHQYAKATRKFDQVLKQSQEQNFTLLSEKVLKQKETLHILHTHDQLQKMTSSPKDHELKRSSIREAIDYLTELTKLVGAQPDRKKKD